MRIDIENITLSGMKPTSTEAFFLELEETYLRYYADYWADEPRDETDHKLGWHNVQTFLDIKMKKEDIKSIQLMWIIPPQSVFKISLFPSASYDIHFYVKKRKEANRIYELIDDYIFGPKLFTEK